MKDQTHTTPAVELTGDASGNRSKICDRCQVAANSRDVSELATEHSERRRTKTLNPVDWPVITLGIY